MKRALVLAAFLVFGVAATLHAQTATDYSYELDNGIKVRTERGWNFVYTTQNFMKQVPPGETGKLLIPIGTVGDLVSDCSIKAFRDGAEVDRKALAPGAYDAAIVCPLSATPGNIRFTVRGITVKPGMDTSVPIVLNDVQFRIEEKTGNYKGLSPYRFIVNRYPGNKEQNLNWGIPWFYTPGNHKKRIQPDEPSADYHGKIRPGTYDINLRISIGYMNFEHRIWLENVTLKPNTSYLFTCNLNAAEVRYAGGNYAVKVLHFYPPGTADKTSGKPRRNAKMERFSIENPGQTQPCPVGKYDVLLNFGHGLKFEWRRDVELHYGKKTEIR